jgi:tetratricopeptide (TPR) repeat protein
MDGSLQLSRCRKGVTLAIGVSAVFFSNWAAMADTSQEANAVNQQKLQSANNREAQPGTGIGSSAAQKAPAKQLQSLGVARPDSAYRYLAEKGAELFREARFAEAENFYRAALVNAESHGVQERQLAMLVTNLATDIRQQQRYDEAEILFDRAIDIEKKSTHKDGELMIYTARQYAELMRETSRDEIAESLMESARGGFEKPIWREQLAAARDDSYSAPANRHRHQNVATVEDDADADGLRQTANVTGRLISPTFVNTPGPNTNVASELKMLADIERTYQNEGMQTQYLQSNFPYMASGPLFGSFGSTGFAFSGNAGFGARTGMHAHHGGHHR